MRDNTSLPGTLHNPMRPRLQLIDQLHVRKARKCCTVLRILRLVLIVPARRLHVGGAGGPGLGSQIHLRITKGSRIHKGRRPFSGLKPQPALLKKKKTSTPPPEVGVVDPATNLSTPKKRKLACLGCPCVCLNWGTFFNSCGSQGNRLDKEQEQLWRVGLRMATHENLPPHNSFVLLPSTILKLVHREPQWQQTYSGHLWLL